MTKKNEWMNSRRAFQDPVMVKDDPVLGQQYAHPGYGQISARRVNGDTTLYDSDFMHHQYIEVEIHESKLCRTTARDWHYASKGIITVALSYAQWANFVSSLNQGSGVPCTITERDHTMVPGIPLRTEENEVKSDVKRHMSEGLKALKDLRDEVANDAKLPVGRRNVILAGLDKALRETEGTVGFVADMFEEYTENVIEEAKIEVQAYVNSTIHRAGLDALGVKSPMALEGNPDVERREED